MKIAVLINETAGRANRKAIQQAIGRALFRTEVTYCEPQSPAELQTETLRQAAVADALIVCGGDGTLNSAVQLLLRDRDKIKIPPLLPLPVGTANDFAAELGISKRLERAARLILESEPKAIDVIEVASGDRSVFMLTNGGLGIAAETAELANTIRTKVREHIECPNTRSYYLPFLNAGQSLLKLAGSEIYEALLAGQMLAGHTSRLLKGWCVTIELENGERRDTSAPFIMVNNQPGLGGKFIPAPLTSNTDGTFNIMLIDSPSVLVQMRSLLKIRQGRIPDELTCPRIETRQATFRSKGNARDLTFFGDGEILLRGVREIKVTCHKHALRVFNGASGEDYDE